MKNIRYTLSISAILLACSLSSFAINALENLMPGDDKDSFSVKASIGYLNGQANEYVYNGEYTISRLDWDLKSIVMGGVIMSGSAGSARFNFGLWTAMTEGSGEMYDYDWQVPELISEWTDKSRSLVDVIDGFAWDASISFEGITSKSIDLRPIIGMKYNQWEWTDQGQEYLYSVNGFRDTPGNFDGANIIDYQQWFFIPYIGLESGINMDPLLISAYLLYSPLVIAQDKDHHILRTEFGPDGIHFEETFAGGSMFGLGINALLDLDKSWFLQFAFDYQLIPEFTGDIYQVETDENFENSAGIKNSISMISIALGVRF